MAGGFALEVTTIGGFTIGIGVMTSTGAALIGTGLATITYHAQDLFMPWKTEFPSSPSSRDYGGTRTITYPTYGNSSSTMQKQKQIDGRLPSDPDQLLNNPRMDRTLSSRC